MAAKPLDFKSKSSYNEPIYVTSQKEGWVFVGAGHKRRDARSNKQPASQIIEMIPFYLIHYS
jgi:hypothetical protein